LLKIIKTIEKEIKKFNPNIIFTHFDKDLNIDHKIISTAVTTATRPISEKSKLEKILFFEVLSSTEWANFSKENIFSPNYFVNIEKYIEIKKELLKLYKKELREWPHPRSIKGIEILSNYRGMACGKKNAEAFLVSKIFK
jgi:LmbE family N-acetylglucosaminyl deacetylase